MIRDVQIGYDSGRRLVVVADTNEEAIQQARALLGEEWPDAGLRVTRVRDTHETIGQPFRGPEGRYVCVAWDWRTGFWMRNVETGELRDVSERAIGRTYHRDYREDAR